MLLPLAATLLAAAPPGAARLPQDEVRVAAYLDADALPVGEELTIRLSVEVADGTSLSKAGMPAALLQIDAPDSVRLAGKELTGYRDLARNEFLEEPWERALEGGETEIAFTLVSAPAAGEVIALNVVGYATTGGEDGPRDWFLRRRLELSLTEPGDAVAVDPTTSAWGRNGTLQIGDRAPAFRLPRADGTELDLADWLGERKVIVTTYRAHW